LDLLNKFKSCQPPIDYLIQLLVPLQPRPYSFCSKNKSQNMEIVFNLIEFEQNNERTYSRNGVATGYLSELHAGKKIFFFKRKFQSFYFPNDEELTVKPLILIGSGTGIAPFMSFLRSKAEKTEILNNVLLFLGIRDSNKDFLFKDELCNFYSKYLKYFSVSYSRSLEGAQYNYSKSKYVYESINHFSAEISKLVYEKNAYIYVCGGTKMSKDVFNALAKSLNEEMKINIEDSEKYLLEMVKNKRYKQDIWA
jgi:sulfite reductase alpha subunit-like flavoprotein